MAPRAQCEGFLYPGVTATVLVCTGAVLAVRGEDALWRRRARRLLFAIAAAGLVLVAAAVLGVAFDARIAGVRVSLTSFQKPLSIALAAAGIACLLQPRVAAALTRRSVAGFYALATALALASRSAPHRPHLGGRSSTRRPTRC